MVDDKIFRLNLNPAGLRATTYWLFSQTCFLEACRPRQESNGPCSKNINTHDTKFTVRVACDTAHGGPASTQSCPKSTHYERIARNGLSYGDRPRGWYGMDGRSGGVGQQPFCRWLSPALTRLPGKIHDAGTKSFLPKSPRTRPRVQQKKWTCRALIQIQNTTTT